MTRAAAVAILRSLAHGLPSDHAGEIRMAERVAGHDESEALRSVLVEVGIRSLLDDPHHGPASDAGDRR